jgi:hypothetical protein
MEYYDFILASIMLSMVSGLFVGLATSLSLNLAVGAGALLAIGFMYHGMFQQTPVQATANRPL